MPRPSEEVFELNEELDTVRDLRAAGLPDEEWRARLAAAAAPIEQKSTEHEAQLRELFAQWDATADNDTSERSAVLHALRDRMLERNYISNLLATIEREATGDGGPHL